MAEILKRACLLRAHTSYGNSDVFVYERDGEQYLVKTFARHNWLARMLGRGAIRHEWKMLRRLRELGFTLAPAPVALLEGDTLVMEYLRDCTPLKSRRHYAEADLPAKERFLELFRQLQRLHELGVVHGDLRRANLLLPASGGIRLLDWATGNYREPGKWTWRPFSRWVHKNQMRSDNYSLVNIVTSYYDDVLPSEFLAAAQPGWLLRLGRFLRYHLYRHGIKRWFHLTDHTQPKS